MPAGPRTPAVNQGDQILNAIAGLSTELAKQVERIDQRFERIDQRFDRFDQRFERLEQGFQRLDQRIGWLEYGFQGLDRRIGGLEQGFQGLDRRIGGLEQEVHTLRQGLDQRFEGIDQKLGVATNTLEELQQQFGSFQSQVADLQGSWVFTILDLDGILTHNLNSQQLLPMRLYNASVNDITPLRYPQRVSVGRLPATRREFRGFTGKCSATMGECEHC